MKQKTRSVAADTPHAPAVARPGLDDDPLWYKDAVIYQLHVRAFFDSGGDGNGDFIGLTEKLDYIKSLGVSAVWLLPFYPSPLRDDGYDIAHYQGVHPAYGTRRDFLTFLNEAHARGLRVITELVINHTSDQHPWFQAARRGKAGSSKRNFYVWSDTPDKYAGVPIVFKDTEPSNWTWDAVAGAYYWHRFFHHQPDLNFDNPLVRKAVIKVMRFWLDMGVDGMRLDAVPYLVEREGTQCANLPETHAVLKEIRRELDARYRNRMLLAEANQWPSDVRSYFGDADGDECHMAFHFPLMPRLFMALRQEDRHPISEVLYQTPELPEGCQWAIFLRNHDELTLEMVSDEERDYMYETYAADPRMRLNAGIRRRLAPLMENSRPRIELLHGLLLSLPGTPVIYYGDELGMGDNVYLGDRNGVRTPMQWSADRNGGFSRADPARLYAPPIMDPVYGYQSVNVEAQERSPHSLLNWMRRMISLRQQHATFGRGTMEMLRPLNRRIFAFIRRYGSEDPVLVVANLSRTVQAVSLDLARVSGLVPVEMTGGVDLPRVTDAPYPLTLGPYSFYWLLLRREAPAPAAHRPMTPAAEPDLDQAPLLVGPEWGKLLDGSIRQLLETRYLPSFLARQPWYGPHQSPLSKVEIVDWGALSGGDEPVLLMLIRTGFRDGSYAHYVLPVTVTPAERADDIRRHTPEAVLVEIAGARKGLLHTRLDGPAGRLLTGAIMGSGTITMRRGKLKARRSEAFDRLDLPQRVQDLPVAPLDFERYHSSTALGERVMLKLVRRLWPDPFPERELRDFLHAQQQFTRVPVVAGTIEYEDASGTSSTLALLDSFVAHQTDAWRHALDDLYRFLDDAPTFGEAPRVPASPLAFWAVDVPAIAERTVGAYLGMAWTLGMRVAQLHRALASPDAAKTFGSAETNQSTNTALADRVYRSWQRTGAELLTSPRINTDEDRGQVQRLMAQDSLVRTMIDDARINIPARLQLTRIHGSLDLAHVLIYEGDFWVIGPAGDATKTPDVRRQLQSPVRDLVVMVRSFQTAAQVAMERHRALSSHQRDMLGSWARCWTAWSAASFLRGYQQAAGEAPWLPDAAGILPLVRVLMLEQIGEEIDASLCARPEWLRMSLRTALDLFEADQI
ncbi:MAG: maltose alpha-D-glucosyltransferase [Vicinamibacterales bacterium]